MHWTSTSVTSTNHVTLVTHQPRATLPSFMTRRGWPALAHAPCLVGWDATRDRPPLPLPDYHLRVRRNAPTLPVPSRLARPSCMPLGCCRTYRVLCPHPRRVIVLFWPVLLLEAAKERSPIGPLLCGMPRSASTGKGKLYAHICHGVWLRIWLRTIYLHSSATFFQRYKTTKA